MGQAGGQRSARYTLAMDADAESTRTLTVVAAVIRDDEGRVLLAQRSDDRHMGGLWEFAASFFNCLNNP